MLSKFRLDELIQRIAAHDAGSIAQVPGIGKKTAEKLILELSDKVGDAGSVGEIATNSAQRDAVLGLMALGYKRSDAESMVRDAASRVSNASVEVLIKEAIRVK